VDEALAGAADRVEVVLHPDGSVEVHDNGRGIPTDKEPRTGLPGVEVVATKLHAGGKFGGGSYVATGGLHGVGLSVVNALSSKLQLRVWRDGKEHFIEFAHGDAIAPLAVVGDSNGKRGTELTFLASTETFTSVEYDFATLEHRLRELAFLNSGVNIVLSDLRHPVEKREQMMYEGGVVEFVKYLDRNKKPMVPAPIMLASEVNGIGVEAALWWNDFMLAPLPWFAVAAGDFGRVVGDFQRPVDMAAGGIGHPVLAQQAHAPGQVNLGLHQLLHCHVPHICLITYRPLTVPKAAPVE